MVAYIAEGQECQKMDENISSSTWKNIGSTSKHEDGSDFYQKAATSYKLAKSWNQAASTYLNIAECHLKVDSKHEAASAYVDAANCYRKMSPIQAISCLEQAVNLLSHLGRFSMAARYCKEVGELYEQLHNFEETIKYFAQAAEFFLGEGAITSASQCKQKVAQLLAQLKQYQKAVEVFEDVAQEAVNSNLLRYGVRGHLLNAGLCRLCKGDLVAVNNALERYQGLDPAFSRTREYKLLTDLVAAYHEEDVETFTEVLKLYDSLSPLDSWKAILLLRVKADIKAKSRMRT